MRLWDSERGGASGVLSQISAKLLVMKERMTATPLVAFEVRSDRGIKGTPPPPKKEPPEGQDPHTASQRSALIRRIGIRPSSLEFSLPLTFPCVTQPCTVFLPSHQLIELDFSYWCEGLSTAKGDEGSLVLFSLWIEFAS